ncbi:MAG: alpha/beta hydrolase [Rhodoferax sp.]|nr:alpha/beta hydrolase [Rhodoferax sp.]
MFVTVNGARLYFDVDGPGLVPDGKTMRERPTLLLLHGGPGFDHSGFKPDFATLTDVAQVVYLDHRGNGRSEHGDPSNWNLAQWGDDVRAFCDVLGIHKPIVYGVSFGGFVAQSYATRHPEHPGKLVLTSTAARPDWTAVFDAFERIGGPQARQIAQDYWLSPTPERRVVYREQCHPLYYTRPASDPDAAARAIVHDPVNLHFASGEFADMDFCAALSRIQCPTLVMAGDKDPITPMAFSEAIAASLPPQWLRFERFADCGHGIVRDAPAPFFATLRDFIRT